MSHARPLNERDRSVPCRTIGFGWIEFPTRNIFIYAPSVVMVRPHHALSNDPTLSILTMISGPSQQEIAIPGSPSQIVDAICDALGTGVPHPLHIAPEQSISHMRRP